MSWSAKTIGELCDQSDGIVQTGPFGSQLKQSEYIDDVAGIPVVMPKDIKEGSIDESEIARISESKAASLNRHMLAAGDIVFPRRGEIGKRGYIKEAGKYFCGTGCLKIHMPDNEVLNKYLFYYLDQDQVVKWLEGRAIGSTMLNLNTSIMRSVNINFPHLQSQERIVSTLSAYDELIENNKRRIELLEDSARQLYKEWFVRFRFPGHEHVKIIDGLPEGWKKIDLLKAAFLTYGFAFKSELFSEEPDGLPLIRIRDVPDRESKTYTLETTSEDKLVADGDFLIGMDGDFHMNYWAGGKAWLNQRVVKLEGISPFTTGYIKHAVQKPIQDFNQTITGTTVRHLGAKHLKMIEVFLPAEALLNQANSFFEDVRNQVVLLSQQNRSLIRARDLLLPKLMSGELAV